MKISFKKINFKKNNMENEYKYEEIYNMNNNLQDKEESNTKTQNNEVRKRRKGAIYSNKRYPEKEKLTNISKNCLKKSTSNFSNFLLNKNNISKKYYALFLATVLLCALSVYMLIKTNNLFSTEDYEVYKSIDGGNKEETLCELTNNGNNESNINNNETNDVVQTSAEAKVTSVSSTNSSTNKTNTVIKQKIVPLSFSKPLNGEVLKPFSIDKIIYSKTLELWKTHDGIDIKADAGTSVKSIEKGVVEKVYNDSFYGMSVVIDHSQGYKSVYSNLGENVPVKVGQSVVKGKVIGKVSNTAIGEIKDDPHLHFMLYKNNEVVDPTYIFGL